MTQRDKMHRCKVCKKLFRDEECTITINADGTSDGLKCPNECVPVYQPTEYELPTND